MADLTADFETGTNGNTVATSDTGSATAWDAVEIGSGATLAYSNTQKYGTLASHHATPSGSTYSRLVWNLAQPTEHYGRAYIYLIAGAGTDRAIVEAQNDLLARETSIKIGADNKLGLYAISTTLRATSTNGLTVNSWNRIEWRMLHDATNGELEVRMFLGTNADGTTEDETVSFTGFSTIAGGVKPSYIKLGFVDNFFHGYIYLDNLVANATTWPGPLTEPIVGRTYKRLYGPAQLTGSAADLYTCPASTLTRTLHIHASNPSGSPVDANLSIGTDAAGTRVWDDFAIPADGVVDVFDPYELTAGEKIQGWAASAGTVVVTITGYEDPV